MKSEYVSYVKIEDFVVVWNWYIQYNLKQYLSPQMFPTWTFVKIIFLLEAVLWFILLVVLHWWLSIVFMKINKLHKLKIQLVAPIKMYRAQAMCLSLGIYRGENYNPKEWPLANQ